MTVPGSLPRKTVAGKIACVSPTRNCLSDGRAAENIRQLPEELARLNGGVPNLPIARANTVLR